MPFPPVPQNPMEGLDDSMKVWIGYLILGLNSGSGLFRISPLISYTICDIELFCVLPFFLSDVFSVFAEAPLALAGD